MDVITSLKPIIYISQIFGLASYGLRVENGIGILHESRTRLNYSKMMFVTICVCRATSFVKIITEIISGSTSFQGKLIRFSHFVCLSMGLFTMYTMTITRGRLICSTLNEMNRFFRKLPRKGKCEKILSNNSKLTFSILMYFPTLFLSAMRSLVTLKRYEWYLIFRSVNFTFNAWIENVFSIQFLLFSNALYAIMVGVNESFASVARGAPPQIVTKLNHLKSRDFFLKNFIQNLNSVYQYNLILTSSWFFMAIMHFVLVRALHLSFYFWIVYVTFRMSSISAVWNFVSVEGERTAHHLHRLFIDSDDVALKEEIELFSLQLMHRRAEFNACGFFNLDFSLLHSMIAAVTTYVVILIQLQTNEETTTVPCVGNCTVRT